MSSTPVPSTGARRARGPAGGGGGPVGPPPEGHGRGGRDVTTAALVGVSIAAAALILFHFGPAYALILAFAVIVLAGAELFTALRRSGFRPATLLGLAAVMALPLAAYWRGEPAIPLVLVLTLMFGMLWFILGLGPNATANLGVTLLGVVWIGVFGSFAALILKIPAEGVSILLVAVISAVGTDAGAFFIGRQSRPHPAQRGEPPQDARRPGRGHGDLRRRGVDRGPGVRLRAVQLRPGHRVRRALRLCRPPVGDLAESVISATSA